MDARPESVALQIDMTNDAAFVAGERRKPALPARRLQRQSDAVDVHATRPVVGVRFIWREMQVAAPRLRHMALEVGLEQRNVVLFQPADRNIHRSFASTLDSVPLPMQFRPPETVDFSSDRDTQPNTTHI